MLEQDLHGIMVSDLLSGFLQMKSMYTKEMSCFRRWGEFRAMRGKLRFFAVQV